MYLRPKLKLSVNNQDKPSRFFRELRDLARNAYPVEDFRNEILLTTFITGLSNASVRWEVRKGKPADDDAALPVETHSYPEINVSKLQTSGITNISNKTSLHTFNNFNELLRSLRTEIQDGVAKSSRPDRNAFQNNQRHHSGIPDSK